MRRQDFINNVTSLSELIEFCDENGLSSCDDIYSDERKDNYINENLSDICRDSNGWQDVLYILRNIPEGYNYYILDEDDWLDFCGISDNGDIFNERKNEVLAIGDDHGFWDDNNDDDDDNDDEFEADTDVALDDFFASSAEDLNKITSEAEANEAEANASFDKFIQRTNVNYINYF